MRHMRHPTVPSPALRRSRLSTTLLALALALVATMSTVGTLPAAAGAKDGRHTDRPHDDKRAYLLRHYDGPCGRFGKYHYFYSGGQPDPFAYCYRPRGYYPYYNSGYWVPRRHASMRRPHFRHPAYYKAWGANRKHYRHGAWHHENHGPHDHAHW
jgi:hypothetical protein